MKKQQQSEAHFEMDLDTIVKSFLIVRQSGQHGDNCPESVHELKMLAVLSAFIMFISFSLVGGIKLSE